MADDDPVRLDTRLAGQIRRYHTWPITGQQTVAEHTWQMLRIYFSVTAKFELHIIHHIQFHDIGEHLTGDAPYPVKSENPQLKEQMDILEQQSLAKQCDYWEAFKPLPLTFEERKFCKQIELIEMAEFGLDQMCLGNKHGFIIANRCLQAVYKMQPPPCHQLVQYVTKRLQLFFQQYKGDQCSPERWWDITLWEELLHDGK
jgi:5'-deoxynucleotidase YfbR-like HD superfamily hydrolase